MERGVFDIGKEELIGRAVRAARLTRYNKGVKHPRWVAVMDLFGLGSSYAHELCHHYGLKPDEEVKR